MELVFCILGYLAIGIIAARIFDNDDEPLVCVVFWPVLFFLAIVFGLISGINWLAGGKPMFSNNKPEPVLTCHYCDTDPCGCGADPH